MDVDTERLNQFVGKMQGDLGGAASVPLVRIGDALGLYKAMHADGPVTPGNWRPGPASTSATCANGSRTTPPPGTSPMIRRADAPSFRPSRRWCSSSRTAP